MIKSEINNLLGVVAEVLEQDTTCVGEAASDLAMFAALMRATPLDEVRTAPARLPVCRFWDEAMTLAGAGASAAVAAALEPLAGSLAWIRNPNFTAEDMGRAFVDNFGYSDLVGPRGLLPSDAFALGVLLLAPHTTYPPHAHPALEIYDVLGGTAEWRRGDAPWTARSPGSLIHHPPGLPHATRTAGEPMLALYLWRGHLDTPAALTGESRRGGTGHA